MKKIPIRYGRGEVQPSIPPSWSVEVLLPGRGVSQVGDTEVVEHALDQPIGSRRLENQVRPGERIALLVNDASRLYQKPSHFLPSILRRLKEGGVRESDLFVVIAGGMHGKISEEQVKEIVGKPVYEHLEVSIHDCRDPAGLSAVRTCPGGDPIFLNRSVVEADRVVATGGIVPHSLAGFAGGSKSVLPGIAGYETIQANHRLAFDEDFTLRPEVRQGVTEGNPLVHEMQAASRVLGVDFMLNVIPGVNGDYAGAVAGDIVEAHQAGCELARTYFGVPCLSKAPLVIASAGGYPRDNEMYQSIKALGQAATVTEAGGTIILLSHCEGGVGPQGWLEWFDLPGPKEIVRRLAQAFGFPGFVAYKTLSITSKHRVILVSGLSPEVVRKLRMEFAESLEEAVDMVEPEVPKDCHVILMPVAGSTSPVLESRGGRQGAHDA